MLIRKDYGLKFNCVNKGGRAMSSGEKCLLTEKDLELERGLKALEIHDRLVVLARLDRRVESALCFYLL